MLSEGARYKFGLKDRPAVGDYQKDRGKLKDTSPINNVEAIKIPILLVHGDKDRSVPIGHSKKMAAKLKKLGKPHRMVVPYEFTPPVQIDIKPDGFPNSVNPRARGVIPVAILGGETFDVTEIDVTTLRFGPDGAGIAHNLNDTFAYNEHLQDVNLDGHMDLVSHFRTGQTGISCGNETATLTGETISGQAFDGSDSIRTVGCRSRGGKGQSRWRSAEEPE